MAGDASRAADLQHIPISRDEAMNAETRLRAARARLVLDRPFIGALVLHLPLVAAPWCGTVATDARALYYNAAFFEHLTLAETQFMLAHAAMHCALGHFARRAHRALGRWDLACDHAVNLLLVDDGMVPPAGVRIVERYRGLSAEEIYPLIEPETRDRTLDEHLFDDGYAIASRASDGHCAARAGSRRDSGADHRLPSDGDEWSDAASQGRRGATRAGSAIGAQANELLAQNWRMRLTSAAHAARQAGRLGASLERLVERTVEPKLPWRSLLARYLMSAARDDYSFLRTSRRGGDALLPSLQSRQIDLCVVLDTSGSIGERELAEFAGEVDALKGHANVRVTLHACDDRLAPGGPWTFQPWQPIVLPERLAGGGGTDFRPVFAWIGEQAMRPDLLVYFTDAEGEFPREPPPYPVVWLVKGAGAVPWGERIQLG